MSYRIVHNEQTNRYRIEKRGFFGWSFVEERDSDDYLSFSDVAAARKWVCKKTRRDAGATRRWKVISECDV